MLHIGDEKEVDDSNRCDIGSNKHSTIDDCSIE